MPRLGISRRVRYSGRMRLLPLCVLLGLLGCAQESGPGALSGPLVRPLAAAGSPLFVHFPELDLRIERVNPRRRQREHVLYPDLWQPDVRAVRDFAVDRRRIFALLVTPDPADDARVYVADARVGTLETTIDLAPAARVLGWGQSGELLVGHVAAASGPPGRVSVIDTDHLKPLNTVDLQGSCISVTGDRAHAYLIERVAQRDAQGDTYYAHRLVHADLNHGRVQDRLALPAGAREVVIGPSGMLYVSHGSGTGLHATDGTISVVDPRDWRLVDRVVTDMIVRKMTPARDLLLISTLSKQGEAWFGALLPDHSTQFDFRFSELVIPQLVVVDEQAYVPFRGADGLLRIILGDSPKLERVRWTSSQPYADRPGLIRAANGVANAR